MHKPKSSVMGLRVEGSQLRPQLIEMELSQYQKCPIAHAAGIPLYVKKIMNIVAKKYQRYAIVRMMSQPSEGLAPFSWQYGGMLPPAPPVLVARSDSIPFEISDWQVLDDFQMEMLDDGPRDVTRKDFIKFIHEKCDKNSKAHIVLEVFYPKGAKCKVKGLIKKQELNGKIGTCNGMYQNGRVGISFENFNGNFGIQTKNLQKIQGEKPIKDLTDYKILPTQISVSINKQTQVLYLQRMFYQNRRIAIYAYDYPQLYDIITYNLPNQELAYNQVIVPVSDRHQWKLQLLKMTQYFEDTRRRVKTGYIFCQIWRLKKMPVSHRFCYDFEKQKCTCQNQKW